MSRIGIFVQQKDNVAYIEGVERTKSCSQMVLRGAWGRWLNNEVRGVCGRT